MANMTKKELVKQRTLKEAWRVFADAMNYSDDSLICYAALIETILGIFSLNRLLDRDILLSNIDKAISTLTSREQEIISMHYGLNGNSPMHLSDIALKFQLSPERIRQIEVRALRKLKHPNIANYIISKEQEKHIEFLIITEEKNKEEAKKELMRQSSIEKLNLSVRAHNCLKRARVDTLSQLAELSYDDLINIKNMGKKTVEEVLQKRTRFLTKLNKKDSD